VSVAVAYQVKEKNRILTNMQKSTKNHAMLNGNKCIHLFSNVDGTDDRCGHSRVLCSQDKLNYVVSSYKRVAHSLISFLESLFSIKLLIANTSVTSHRR